MGRARMSHDRCVSIVSSWDVITTKHHVFRFRCSPPLECRSYPDRDDGGLADVAQRGLFDFFVYLYDAILSSDGDKPWAASTSRSSGSR